MQNEAGIRIDLDKIDQAWRQDPVLFAHRFIEVIGWAKELFKELDQTRIERDALRYRLQEREADTVSTRGRS